MTTITLISLTFLDRTKRQIKKRKKQIQKEKAGFTEQEKGRTYNPGFLAAKFGHFSTGHTYPFFDRR